MQKHDIEISCSTIEEDVHHPSLDLQAFQRPTKTKADARHTSIAGALLAYQCSRKSPTSPQLPKLLPSPHEQRNEEKEQLLNEWKDLADRYSEMHNNSARFYSNVNMTLTVPNILMSAGAGASALFSDEHRRTKPAWALTIGIVGLASATLSAMNAFLKLNERHTQHTTAATEFEKLARDIRVELVLHETSNRMYVNHGEFIKQCCYRFDRLMDGAPVIPSGVYRKQDNVINQDMYLYLKQLLKANEVASHGRLHDAQSRDGESYTVSK